MKAKRMVAIKETVKVRKTIASCTTLDQLAVAKRMVKLWKRRYEGKAANILDISLKHKERVIRIPF